MTGRVFLRVYKSHLLSIRIENVIESGFTIAWDANDLYSNYRVGVGVEDIDEVLHVFPTSGSDHKIVRNDIVDSYYCRLIGSLDGVDYSSSIINSVYYPHIDSIVSVSDSGFVIKWSLVPGVSGYIIEVSRYSDFSSTSIILSDTIGPAIDSVYVNNLYPNFRYYSRMRYWLSGD